MISDEIDAALNRIIDLIPVVDAWQDYPTNLYDHTTQYVSPLMSLSDPKKTHKSKEEEFKHYHQKVQEAIEVHMGIKEGRYYQDYAVKISASCLEFHPEKKVFDKHSDGKKPEGEDTQNSIWMLCMMALRTIQHIPHAHLYLDKSVGEVEELAANKDNTAILLLPVIKALNWKNTNVQ